MDVSFNRLKENLAEDVPLSCRLSHHPIILVATSIFGSLVAIDISVSGQPCSEPPVSINRGCIPPVGYTFKMLKWHEKRFFDQTSIWSASSTDLTLPNIRVSSEDVHHPTTLGFPPFTATSWAPSCEINPPQLWLRAHTVDLWSCKEGYNGLYHCYIMLYHITSCKKSSQISSSAQFFI